MRTFALGCLEGLMLSVEAGAESWVRGRVRLASGEAAAGVQVMLFDGSRLGRPARTVTDEAGHFSLTREAMEQAASRPSRPELGPNYPNPFNPSTILPYRLPTRARVRLDVFNLLGQRLSTLVDEVKPAGSHTAAWDGRDGSGRALSAGVYLYRLTAGEVRRTRSMVLLDGAAAGGAGSPPSTDWVPPREEPQVYGLVVSGPGLVPYVDPGFRVGAGGAFVDVSLEASGSAPRAKAASGGAGRLGDVDNNGTVDRTDALLVLLYSLMPSIVLPNDGDVSLGDVNRDGRVDGADAQLIEAYSADPSDPDLPPGIGAPAGMGTGARKLYWTDAGSDRIQRSDLDGSGVEDVIDIGLVTPRGLAVDQPGGKLYWTDYGSDRIQRADLDGSGIEEIIATGLEIPLAVAVDPSAGKIYWSDNGTDKIQRANLDGSGVEDLVTGLQSPLSLALDTEAGKLYWTDSGTDKIQRADLDGSGIEDLITVGLDIPRGLALDPSAGRLYWTDNGTGRIQRANLDGSGVEEIIATGLEIPRALVLDAAGGKLYWADSGSDRIQRANLDGSGIEDLVTGLSSPRGLALVRMASPDDVRVPDAALRSVLQDSLGLAPGDPIPAAELARLTVLEAPDAGIVDLTGLEHATGLTRLHLGWGATQDLHENSNEITDLAPLSGLTVLTWLHLGGNSVVDVTPLAGLTDLTWLNLQGNRIQDASPLLGLSGLTHLFVGFNPLRNESLLLGLTGLIEDDLRRPSTYPQLDSPLNDLVRAYEAALEEGRISSRIVPGHCVRDTSPREFRTWDLSEPAPSIRVEVGILVESVDSVGRFLEQHDISVDLETEHLDGYTWGTFTICVPLPLLVPLTQQTGVLRARLFVPPEKDSVTVPDSALRAVLKDSLGLAADEPISLLQRPGPKGQACGQTELVSLWENSGTNTSQGSRGEMPNHDRATPFCFAAIGWRCQGVGPAVASAP